MSATTHQPTVLRLSHTYEYSFHFFSSTHGRIYCTRWPPCHHHHPPFNHLTLHCHRQYSRHQQEQCNLHSNNHRQTIQSQPCHQFPTTILLNWIHQCPTLKKCQKIHQQGLSYRHHLPYRQTRWYQLVVLGGRILFLQL